MFAISRLADIDASRVSDLVADVVSALPYYSSEAQRSEIAKYTPEDLRAAVAEDPDAVLIAKSDDGGVVGFCISNTDDGLIWLAWFGVHRDWRAKGVGRALLGALQQTVRSRGAHKIWCDCRTSNLASTALLTAVGFTIVCTLTNHWYGHDFHLLEKPIPQ